MKRRNVCFSFSLLGLVLVSMSIVRQHRHHVKQAASGKILSKRGGDRPHHFNVSHSPNANRSGARQSRTNTIQLYHDHAPNSRTVLLPAVPSSTSEERVRFAIGNYSDASNPLINCNITSQVLLHTDQMPWIMESLDSTGSKKTVGGDEFYVVYKDSNEEWDATAVAWIQDLHNGSYGLDFVTVPIKETFSNLTGHGNLTIYFQYSCGIGFTPQPLKDNWKDNGSTCLETTAHVKAPRIRVFQAPTISPNFSEFSRMVSFGDSLLQQLVFGYTRFFRKDVFWKANVNSELTSETLDKRFIPKLREWHGGDLQDPTVGLVIGSSVWDILQNQNIQTADFRDHLQACRLYIARVQKEFPNTTVFWKSPSTLHVHRMLPGCNKDRRCAERVRYMSASRSEFLYRGQKQIMAELRIPFLDLYEGYFLSAPYTVRGDGRHYQPKYDRRMLRWLYSNKTVTPSIFLE